MTFHDRFDDDDFRRLGLYVDRTDETVTEGPLGPVPVLVVEATIGAVAFTDRVVDPEKDAIDSQFREMEASMLTDEFLDAHERMRRNIAAGRDPLDDGDDA